MSLKILHAKNKEDMITIEQQLLENKFKQISSENNYILMKKRRYGNTIIQLGVLFFALFYFYPLILVNLVYFSYSYLLKSPTVLITTETKDDEGENLEFDSMNEILESANAIL